MDAIMIRYGELALKGKNRYIFEKALVRNLKDLLGKICESSYEVIRLRGRILIRGNLKDYNGIRRVFGVSSFSPCTEADLDDIQKSIDIDSIKSPFRVTCTRSDKSYPINSMDLQKVLGAYIVEKTGYSVNLVAYATDVGVEIINKKAYIYYNSIKGFAGLPVGTQDRLIGLIQDRYDILACLLLMRRGCSITPAIIGDCDISLLDSFNFGAYHKPINIENITDFLKDRHEIAVCTGSRDLKAPELAGKLLLQPLVGYSDEEIDALELKFYGC